MNLDDKILEKNIEIHNLMTRINNGFEIDMGDIRNIDDNLKEGALEQLEELKDRLQEAFEVVVDLVCAYALDGEGEK